MILGNWIFSELPGMPVPKESQIDLAKDYFRDVRVNHFFHTCNDPVPKDLYLQAATGNYGVSHL
jgi:hypothetical protein